MTASVFLAVCPSVCSVPRHNSRTERPTKSKIGRMETHHTGKPCTYLEVKMSRSPGRLMLSQTMHNAHVGGNSRDAKVKVEAYFIK